MDSMSWSKGLDVNVGGHGVVSHIGSAATRLLADRAGLTGALSRALARRGFVPLHDRGRVLTDTAVAIADGATTIAGIDTLRHQGELFGQVASDTTAWRALSQCDGVAVARVAKARAKVRRHVRDLIEVRHGGIPHALIEHVTALNARPGYQVHYSAGFDFDERIRAALPRLPASAWTPALDADGTPRPDAQVAELTGLLRHSTGGDRLAGWPADMRILIRRENPHPGAQLSLSGQHDGKRYQVTATSTPRGQVQFLEARHRTQARAEDSIRCAKSTGLGHLPSRDYVVNTAWCQAASIACDLLAWLRLLALDGDLAKAEPKTLRYRILHTAGRIVKGQRRRHLKITASWPWAQEIADAFARILALPPP